MVVTTYEGIHNHPTIAHSSSASCTIARSSSGLLQDVVPSHPDMQVEVKGSTQVELGFGNGVIDDVPGYSLTIPECTSSGLLQDVVPSHILFKEDI
ncbi:nodal modulator 1-like protein [Trifolium pratense]|uniref:Nodal modulator 1-like protein n=1 Tax=Trifolium pratense TaxID=57577 RepID=A0A2K3KH20_TRIPR|nr:nodal modulator 1-like protein [Trifolium pratense]